MPDDTTPESTGPESTGPESTGPESSGDGPETPATPESWDTATQATPLATPAGDLTQSIPVDTTRSIAQISTPPSGTPAVGGLAAAAAAGAGAGAGAGDAAGGGGRSRSASQRAWIIALVALAVLVVGGGIALAATSGGGPKKAGDRGGAPNIPGPTTTAATGPICPLTGLPAPGGAVPQRPALAVKVDDYPDARPQSGLGEADIVFDEPVEGGITRFAAVFQCQSPSLIGPIRSARAVDLQIMDQLSKPILVHVGGINPVIDLLRDGNLTDFDLRTHGSVVQNGAGAGGSL